MGTAGHHVGLPSSLRYVDCYSSRTGQHQQPWLVLNSGRAAKVGGDRTHWTPHFCDISLERYSPHERFGCVFSHECGCVMPSDCTHSRTFQQGIEHGRRYWRTLHHVAESVRFTFKRMSTVLHNTRVIAPCDSSCRAQ